jgi:hypothetical protein
MEPGLRYLFLFISIYFYLFLLITTYFNSSTLQLFSTLLDLILGFIEH